MFYNYFNKFITGLGLNRAVFAGETPEAKPKRAPEGVVSMETMDKALKDYSEGKVIMAAGETTDEYMARMEKMKQDDKKKLAELEAKNKRTPVYAETTETPFGDISVAKKGKPRLTDRKQAVVGLRTEEEATAKPEPSAVELAEKARAKKEAEKEIARLDAILQKKPEAPAYDQGAVASKTGEGAAEETKKGELAALDKSKEASGSEFAYVREDMQEANVNKLAHWMQDLKFVAEEVSKGKNLEDAINKAQARVSEYESVNVGYLGQMAEKAGVKAGMNEKQIASLIFAKFKDFPGDRNKRLFLQGQFNNTYKA
jgi:hypothetical protein